MAKNVYEFVAHDDEKIVKELTLIMAESKEQARDQALVALAKELMDLDLSTTKVVVRPFLRD